MKDELLNRKYDLLRMRWQLLNRRTTDPEVLPAAIWWIDCELSEINMALER